MTTFRQLTSADGTWYGNKTTNTGMQPNSSIFRTSFLLNDNEEYETFEGYPIEVIPGGSRQLRAWVALNVMQFIFLKLIQVCGVEGNILLKK